MAFIFWADTQHVYKMYHEQSRNCAEQFGGNVQLDAEGFSQQQQRPTVE